MMHYKTSTHHVVVVVVVFDVDVAVVVVVIVVIVIVRPTLWSFNKIDSVSPFLRFSLLSSPQQKFSYFPPLVFSDSLQQVSLC